MFAAVGRSERCWVNNEDSDTEVILLPPFSTVGLDLTFDGIVKLRLLLCVGIVTVTGNFFTCC